MEITLLLLLSTYICPSRTFTRFNNEPFNEQQAEGGIAYFSCMVIGLEDSEYVSWIHNGKKITEGGKIINEDLNNRYILDRNILLGTYNLHIQNIQRIDKGQYKCTVFKLENEVVADSRPANLTVLEIPKEHYPICSPILATYTVGQTIRLTCRTEITNPLSHLTWKRNNMDVISQVETHIDGSYEVSYSTIIRKKDQRSTFTCELTTSANSAIQRNCSSGPINVLYLPHVRIEQTDVAVVGKEVIFICYSDSNPPEVTYEWAFNPPLDDSLYSLENHRILRILNVKANFNNTSIICKSTNSIGSQSQTLKILVFNYKSKDSSSLASDGKTKSIPNEKNKNAKDQTNIKYKSQQTIPPNDNKTGSQEFSLPLIVAIGVACIVVILGLALIPVGYMRYTRRQPSDTTSRGRPVSIPDVYFEPRDHVDPMLPQLGLSAPWMRTVGVQVPGECEYDVTYNTQVMPQLRQVYYSQRMYPTASLQR